MNSKLLPVMVTVLPAEILTVLPPISVKVLSATVDESSSSSPMPSVSATRLPWNVPLPRMPEAQPTSRL